MTYASSIFASTNVGISPNLSAILLAIAQLTGNLFTTKLVDTIGRKILINVSLAGCALSLMTTGIYFYFEYQGYDLTNVRWTPVISLSFAIFIGSAGIIPLTAISTVEAMPPKVIFILYQNAFFCIYNISISKVRTFGMTLTAMVINIFAFIVSKFFPILSEIIHMHGCFGIMSVICVLGILFVYFTMDETKGQCLDDIGSSDNNKVVNFQLSRSSNSSK